MCALAAYHDLSATPVDILQLECGDLRAAQPELGQRHQHRVVTTPCRCRDIVAGAQQRLHLLIGQTFGQ